MSDDPVVAVILVGVGRVPETLAAAAADVLGPQSAVETLCIPHPVAVEEARRSVEAAVQRVDQGRGVLLLADLCGSSVSNVCYALARERSQMDVLCGANLAMLTKLYSVDRAHLSATDLARLLADTGRRSITLASDAFAAERDEEDRD